MMKSRLSNILIFVVFVFTFVALGYSSTTKAYAYSINIDVVEEVIKKYYPQLVENKTLSTDAYKAIVKTLYYDDPYDKYDNVPKPIAYNYCKGFKGDGSPEVWVKVYPFAPNGHIALNFGQLSSTQLVYWGVEPLRGYKGYPEFTIPKKNLIGVRFLVVMDPKENYNPNDDKADYKIERQYTLFDQPIPSFSKLPTCDKI